MALPDRRKIIKTVRVPAEPTAEVELPDEVDDGDGVGGEAGPRALDDGSPDGGSVGGESGDDGEPTRGDARIEEYQEELVTRRAATIAAARRRHGTAGAAIAAVGLQLQKMYEGKEDNEPAVIVEASSDPEDLDAEGININLEGDSYHAPPLERLDGQS